MPGCEPGCDSEMDVAPYHSRVSHRMGKETIHGKKDDAKHEGKRGELKRIAEMDEQLRSLWPELWDAAKQGKLEEEPTLDKPNKKE